MRFTIGMLIFLFTSLSGLVGSFASAKPVPVQHYARMPQFYSGSLSPDGKLLAVIMDRDGEYVVRVVNLDDPQDKRTRVTTLSKGVKVNWISWASNERFLVSTRQSEKLGGITYDTGYLYSIDKDVENTHLVLKPDIKGETKATRFKTTVGYRQFNNRVIDLLPDEPNHILMVYGVENQFAPGVHKVDITGQGKNKKIRNGNLKYQSWITDGDHQVRVGEGRKDQDGEYQMIIRDTNGETWQGVKNYPGLSAETNVFGFTENTNELVIGDYDGKDTLGIVIYDLNQKRRTRKLFQHEKYDVSGLIRSDDGKRIVGVRYIANQEEKVFFDPQYKARMDKIQASLPGFQIRFIDQTRDGKKILFKAGAASNPNVLFVYNTDTDKHQFIGNDYPEISDILQGDVTAFKYTARDGFKIPAYLTTPPKIAAGLPLKNLPFIIMPHGGPYARDTKSFDTLAQFMTSRGYAVLQMNFRGSEGFGKAYEAAGRENWEIMQDDVEDGARWLIKKGYADPKRICIVGWSYGGYAALMGAIKNPDIYACSASIAGVTDLKSMVRDLRKFRFGKFTSKYFILRGFEDRHDIKANSPAKRALELTIPLLLVHGAKDSVVQIGQYDRMKKALKKSKSEVKYIKFEDGDHSLTNVQDRLKLFDTLDDFLEEHLGKSEAAP